MALKISIVTLVVVTATFLMANVASSIRDVRSSTSESLPNLAQRLQLNEDGSNNVTDCWSALSELRQCSNEIVAFFLNGYTDIDAPCCQAIEIIVGHCWPSMLTVLGFNEEEGKLLAGYCVKTSAPAAAPPTV